MQALQTELGNQHPWHMARPGHPQPTQTGQPSITHFNQFVPLDPTNLPSQGPSARPAHPQIAQPSQRSYRPRPTNRTYSAAPTVPAPTSIVVSALNQDLFQGAPPTDQLVLRQTFQTIITPLFPPGRAPFPSSVHKLDRCRGTLPLWVLHLPSQEDVAHIRRRKQACRTIPGLTNVWFLPDHPLPSDRQAKHLVFNRAITWKAARSGMAGCRFIWLDEWAMEGALVSSDRTINVHFSPSCGPNIGAEASAPHLVWTLATAQAQAAAISTTTAATTVDAAPTAATRYTARDKGKARAMPNPRPPPLPSGVPLWRAVLD